MELGLDKKTSYQIDLINGGESDKVGEHLSSVLFELEAYPEPKVLSSQELKRLITIFGTTVAVAKFIGCSQSHISEKANG
jgi:hypothetical protein